MIETPQINHSNEKDNKSNSRIGETFSNICLSIGNACEKIHQCANNYRSQQMRPGVTEEKKEKLETEKQSAIKEKLEKLTTETAKKIQESDSLAAKEFLKNLLEFKDRISEITNSKGIEFTKFIQEKYQDYSKEFQEKFSTENNQPMAFG